MIQSMAVTGRGRVPRPCGRTRPGMSRRDRLRHRAAPLVALAAVACARGLTFGALGESETQRTAERWADAWRERDYGAMWRLLDGASQRELSPQELRSRFEEALRTATAIRLE